MTSIAAPVVQPRAPRVTPVNTALGYQLLSLISAVEQIGANGRHGVAVMLASSTVALDEGCDGPVLRFLTLLESLLADLPVMDQQGREGFLAVLSRSEVALAALVGPE